MHYHANPPQAPPLLANITPAIIQEEVASAVQRSTTLRNRLATSLTPATATFENLIRPLLDDQNRARCRVPFLTRLLAKVSPDPEIRQASRDAAKQVADAEAGDLLRTDIALLVRAVFERENNGSPGPRLDGEDRHVLEYMYGCYRRAGAYVTDDTTKARLATAESEIADIKAAAMKEFTEESTSLWLTGRELDGCPEAWLATLRTEKGSGSEGGGDTQDRFCVSLSNDIHYFKVLETAISEDTRKKVWIESQKRCPENVQRISKLMLLRDEIARLLGYEHHAALRMETTMMRSLMKLQEVLEDISFKLAPLATRDMAILLELKRARLESEGVSVGEIQLYAWDQQYYQRIQKMDKFTVDSAKVSEYFEVKYVVFEMLNVFKELFGMRFVSMTHIEAWHESVLPFAAWDSEEDGEFLGYLFLDIYSRPGKFSQQYCSRIQPGFTDTSGVRHYPAGALITSYDQSTAERPGLLPHFDVRVLFHELGHAIHHLVDRRKHADGESSDFVEIPSNILEHFVWVPEVMVRLSRHYTTLPAYDGKSIQTRRVDDVDDNGDATELASGGDGGPTTTTIPLDLARSVARTKTLNQAPSLLSLLRGAAFDLAIYSPKTHEEAAEMDTTLLWNEIRRRYSPHITIPDGISSSLWGQAQFTPLFQGWDVSYFKHVMSRVYAADLYEATFAKDPLSAEAGRKWRYQVLERAGGSEPELDMLERFLGRPVSVDAIFKQIVSAQDWLASQD